MRVGLWVGLAIGGLSAAAMGQVPEVSAPPLPVEEPLKAGPDPAFIEAVDRQLLSFRQEGLSVTLANREKSLKIAGLFWDEDLTPMFAAVPSSLALFQEARQKNRIASILTLGGLVGSVGALGIAVAAILLPQLTLTLLIAAVLVDVVALVLTAIGLPFQIRSQGLLYEAVESHNRGLLRLPIAEGSGEWDMPPGGLVFRF